MIHHAAKKLSHAVTHWLAVLSSLHPPLVRVSKKQAKVPTKEDFIKKRDFTGALALLEFQVGNVFFKAGSHLLCLCGEDGPAANARVCVLVLLCFRFGPPRSPPLHSLQKRRNGDNTEEEEIETLMWIGYCAFHLGKYERAQEVYMELMTGDLGKCPKEVPLYLACVYYYMQMYKEAQDSANDVDKESPLKNRVLFHVCHKLSDEHKLMQHHQKLSDTNEDQLSLAAIHYLRGHFQEATDIYKRLLLENRDDLALNVYVAMCYYKLDYYDVSLEILAVYLQTHPDSAVAINLKACNHFRLYNGKAAEAELKVRTAAAAQASSC